MSFVIKTYVKEHFLTYFLSVAVLHLGFSSATTLQNILPSPSVLPHASSSSAPRLPPSSSPLTHPHFLGPSPSPSSPHSIHSVVFLSPSLMAASLLSTACYMLYSYVSFSVRILKKRCVSHNVYIFFL